MTRISKSVIAIFALCLSFALPSVSFAQTAPAPCVLGYTVGFFNGVWNTELEAVDGRNALQDAFREASGKQDDTYNNEDVNYELFYNHSGGTVGATGLQDIAEVFLQRANELDPTGVLAKNGFYFFWESYSGDTPGYSGVAGGSSPQILAFINNFANAVVQGALTTLSKLFSSPPTNDDYANQQAQLDQLAAAGRKFVLVAHSQGNLFLNQAYDHIQPEVGSTRVKAVHVAPASPTLRGQWTLANIDLVINGLRLANGANTVPDINLTLLPSSSDPSGHTLVGTYLDASRPGRGAVQSLLTNAFSALETSSCAVTVTPASREVSPKDSVALTAKLDPAPQDTKTQISYSWVISGSASGTFVQSGGNSPTVKTLSPTITYVANQFATAGAIDTITVSAYAGPGVADPTMDELLGKTTAVITISHFNVTLMPRTTTLNGLGNQILTAAESVPPDVSGYTYMWSTTGVVGYLGEIGGGNRSGLTSYCSTSAEALYSNTVANVAALTAPVTDTVTVAVFKGSGCIAANQVGVPASATVTTNPVTVSLTPPNASINTGAQQPFKATVAAVADTSSFSYQWTAGGTAGTISPAGGTFAGVKTFCSSSPQVIYGANSMIAGNSVVDTVSVQVFNAANCPTGKAVASAKSTITVNASAQSFSGLGAWQCNRSNSTFTLTFYAMPFLTGNNFVQAPPGSTLMFTENYSIGGQSYGYLFFSGLEAWDSRYPSFAEALANGYQTFTVTGAGTLGGSDGSSCSR